MIILWHGRPHLPHRPPAPRGDTSMQQHGPSDLSGPLRGTSAWWQSRAAQPEHANDGAATPNTTQKGKRMKRGKRGKRTAGAEAIRPELIERIRREIAEGTYDSAEKWEAAL